MQWYQQIQSSVVVWTASPRPTGIGHVYVALRVPTHYSASDAFLTALSEPLKLALP